MKRNSRPNRMRTGIRKRHFGLSRSKRIRRIFSSLIKSNYEMPSAAVSRR
ncbi:MAG TPA: hypothetical protein PLM53_03310 [Spirochaetota bacterium]|mgnify:CR=1 FL=1|nr:hypothetical protein [Spirochaetota bacterium]HPC40323.1 hypothetical protein [Spirochaetota bacterium]HQF07203.1 hypothetical protein [Spirochaetota bacterium]HQH96103.1 hypothetical protein [Spirochaetota bacterium]HQJ69279.1 hypothetical protein [Spirochaetota bacterium]